MKKRMLSILLVAMMLFSTMSVLAISVSAAEDPYLKVAGATMTDGQYLVKGSMSPITELPANADSYAYYKDGILTLHNYSLNDPGMEMLIEANGKLSLKILLEGENVLKGNPETTTAIWTNHEVDIMGSGSLTISDVACGIDKSNNDYGKNLYITDATLNISSTNEAINSTSTLKVTAAKLTVESTAAGISAIKNSGETYFYASEVEATAKGYAIEAAGGLATVNIYGSKVKAVSSGSQAIKYSYDLRFDNGGITENVVTKASTNADGSSWVTYEKNNNSTYKYVECELPGYFVVSFDANGGSGYTKSAAFRNGENGHADYLVCTFTAPDGKYFAGWDKNIVGVPVTENITLKATWKEKTDIDYIEFSISGYEAGNKLSDIEITAITEGVVIDETTMKFKDLMSTLNAETVMEANFNCFISFEFYFDKADRYNIIFGLNELKRVRMNGMAADSLEYDVETGRYTVKMAMPVIPESDLTLEFFADENAPEAIKTVATQGFYELPTPESMGVSAPDNGKRFAGWAWTDNYAYDNLKGWYPVYQPGESTFIGENRTLVAKWEEIPSFTVNFYKNDGTGAIEKSVTLYEGEKITVANFPTLADRGEYKFYGWSLAKDSYVPITSDIQPTEDTNVYAIWRANVDKVTFKIEGYEIGKNVKDIRLTDDKGFLTTNVIDLNDAIFCIYQDKDGQPLIATSAEEAEAYMKFINEGKFEEGKNYWVVVVIQNEEYHTGAGGKQLVVPKTPSGYKLEGAADATVKIMGDAIGFCFKLDPLTKVEQTPPVEEENKEEASGNATPDTNGSATTPDAETNGSATTPDAGTNGSASTPDAGTNGSASTPDTGTNGSASTPDSSEPVTNNKPDSTESSANTDETTDGKKSGCGSSLALSGLATVTIIGTALVIKKKEI